MIKIVHSTRKKIKDFSLQEWHDLDIEHYGKAIEWKEKHFLFRASDGHTTLGYVEGKHESGVIYVFTIIVSKSERGQGIGKKLLTKAEKWGKKQGAHKVHLLTGKGWESTKFYQSLGYSIVAELPNHHFHTTFVIFEKII